MLKYRKWIIFTSCKGINHKYIAVEKGKQKMNKKGMKRIISIILAVNMMLTSISMTNYHIYAQNEESYENKETDIWTVGHRRDSGGLRQD